MKRTALAATAACALLAMLAACGDSGGTDAPEGAPADDAAAVDEAAPADGAAGEEQAAIDLPTDADPATYNLSASEQYLADNARRPEVTLTTSGLQYEVWQSGPAGARQPGPSDWVCVSYTGMLPDGTVFDSNDALPLQLFMVIQGWQEGLQLMAEGDSWRLFIPPELGYGPRGAGGPGGIPPNAALVFDVGLQRVLETTDLAVLPNGEVDPAWNCAEASAPAADGAGAAD